MKKLLRPLCSLLLFALSSYAQAGPPTPPMGFRWVLQEAFSDEFNGNNLDKTKWRDSFDGWKGRSPAKFDPSTVSVKDGSMQIRNKKLAQRDGDYTIGGGAVQSLSDQAFYGYYECRFKASRINMSTTFWMSNKKVAVNMVTKKSNGVNCAQDKFSQELDICESVGGTGNFSSKFRTQQNFNTHYRYIDCNGGKEKFYSAGNNAVEGNGQQANASIEGESWEDFHVYACYWKSANEADFYTDNRFAGTVKFSTEVVNEPFPRRMRINMVTETYNWAKPYPTDAQLANNNINTSYYDWIRSYELVPVSQDLGNQAAGFVALYSENADFMKYMGTRPSASSYAFELSYQANSDRNLTITIKNSQGVVVATESYNAYTGYGRNNYSVSMPQPLPQGNYTVEAALVPKNGGNAIHLESRPLTIGNVAPLEDAVAFFNAPSAVLASQQITLDVQYTATEPRDLVMVLHSPSGQWLGNQTVTVPAGTSVETMTINLANTPDPGENYKLTAILRGVGGDWSTNVVLQDIFVDLLEQGTCPTSEVFNECFEGDGFSTWTGWGAATKTVVTGESYGGNYALRVAGLGAAELVLDNLKPNTTYTLSGYVKIKGTTPVNLGVKEFDNAGSQDAAINSNTTYQEKSVKFTTGAGTTSAKIYFFSTQDNGEGYLDNVQLTEETITGTTQESSNALFVYPNPAKSTLTIGGLAEVDTWALLDVLGQVRRQGVGNKVEVSDLASGIYVLEVGEHLIRIRKE